MKQLNLCKKCHHGYLGEIHTCGDWLKKERKTRIVGLKSTVGDIAICVWKRCQKRFIKNHEKHYFCSIKCYQSERYDRSRLSTINIDKHR